MSAPLLDLGEQPRDHLVPFLPRLTLQWLLDHPARRRVELEGPLVFVDISRFSALSERAPHAVPSVASAPEHLPDDRGVALELDVATPRTVTVTTTSTVRGDVGQPAVVHARTVGQR